ncbi:MAG: DUF2807 domain-containing protein [Saprospiraceae bacterium]
MKSRYTKTGFVQIGKNTFLLIFILFLWVESSVLLYGQSVVLGEFQKIRTVGDVSVELIHSTENKATYSIQKGFERDLAFDIKEDVLTIKVKAPENAKYNRLVTKASVKLYYKELREITISALSSVSTKDTLVSPFLRISARKGSKGTFVLKCFDLKIDAIQKATVYLQGKTETLKLEAGTHSVIVAESLYAKEIEVLVNSESRVSAYAEKAIYGQVSTGGKLNYKGSPQYKNIQSESGGFVKGPND